MLSVEQQKDQSTNYIIHTVRIIQECIVNRKFNATTLQRYLYRCTGMSQLNEIA